MTADYATEIKAAGLCFKQDAALAHRISDPAAVIRRTLAAELCETRLQVSVIETGSLTDLDLAQFGAYRFDAATERYAILRSAKTSELQHEAMHGPLLLHALAHRGVHVMHASALQASNGSVWLFCAESGVGKSTLAAQASGLGWTRLADDLLPISQAADGRLVAMPHLEQPKLPAAAQYPAHSQPSLPLAAFVRLRRGPKAALRHLVGTEVLECVLRNTVATRIYASACLVAHLEFCGLLAAKAGQGELLVAELTIADRPRDLSGAAGEALDLLQQHLPA